MSGRSICERIVTRGPARGAGWGRTALLGVFLATGCVIALHPNMLTAVHAGMTQQELAAELGPPHEVRGGVAGPAVEVWRYRLKDTALTWYYYDFVFVDGALERWGKPADTALFPE